MSKVAFIVLLCMVTAAQGQLHWSSYDTTGALVANDVATGGDAISGTSASLSIPANTELVFLTRSFAPVSIAAAGASLVVDFKMSASGGLYPGSTGRLFGMGLLNDGGTSSAIADTGYWCDFNTGNPDFELFYRPATVTSFFDFDSSHKLTADAIKTGDPTNSTTYGMQFQLDMNSSANGVGIGTNTNSFSAAGVGMTNSTRSVDQLAATASANPTSTLATTTFNAFAFMFNNTSSSTVIVTLSGINLVPTNFLAITTEPANQTVTTGENATFSVVAGGANLAYQWYFDTNTLLSLATNASYTVTNAHRINTGTYSVIVTNTSGSVTSSYALLAISDTPPVAGSVTFFRPADLTLKMPIADLLTNDSDADGDTVTITSIGPTTTNGVNLFTDATYIYYTNAPDVDDRFNYTISDGFGGTATGAVYVVMSTQVFGQAQTISTPGATTTLEFAGYPGSVYEVERSTNLTTWVAVSTNTAPAAGAFQAVDSFADLGGVRPAQAYYRLEFSALKATAPVITTQPRSQSIASGDTAIFTATASGFPLPTYQWYFGSSILGGQTGTNLTADTAGDYDVVAANSGGSVTSAVAVLTVVIPPAITTQPTNLIVTAGQNATFTVAATGTAPLSYQWYFNTNTVLVHDTNTSLTVTSAQSTNAGSYSVIVTNAGGSLTSSVVTLTVLVPPSITTQPTNFIVTAGENATFTAAAAGTGPLGYQWYFNTNTPLPGDTNASVTIAGAQPTNAGTYSLLVTNLVGSVTSSLATLTVNASGAKPSITTQPTNFTASVGQGASFTVAASGLSPLAYQWYFNANTLLTGATNATLAFTNIQADGLGGYSVVVTNAMGSVTSSVAHLLVAALAGQPPLPSITGAVYVVTSYGAVGDGVATNTTAIQNAIDAANTAGGGVVEIPAGTFLSGPLTLKSKIDFQLDSGALLQMLPYGTWPGTTTFIDGSSLTDVEISGPGTIDGQGAPWWAAFESSGIDRPNFVQFSSCNRVSIQDVTLQNPPTFHLMLKNKNANLTIEGITINTPGTSPNTDGMDLASTNILIQHCYISDGDDNIEIGGSDTVAELLVTNCTFGTGHGVSMGSIVSGGVSNVTVVNCTFNDTEYGIRMKSDNDRGGVVQNLNYYNLGMTNIQEGAIVIYSYYEEVGTPTDITPADAAAEPVASVNSETPIWRNIVISNLTATVADGGVAGIIWARTELPATNLLFSHLNITAPANFDLYNVRGLTIADSQFTLPAGPATFSLFNAQFTLTNSTAATNLFTFDGITTNGYDNTWGLFDTQAAVTETNALGTGPLTLGGTNLFTVNNDLTLFSGTTLNYVLGAAATTNRMAVAGNLTLGGTINLTTNAGFGTGTYTLMTYTGALSGNLPTLGTTPSGFVSSLNTNTAGQVKLIVSP